MWTHWHDSEPGFIHLIIYRMANKNVGFVSLVKDSYLYEVTGNDFAAYFEKTYLL